MSSAAEAAFRVQTPASCTRAVKVISLHPASDSVVRRLAERPWKGVSLFPASTIQSIAPLYAAGSTGDAEGVSNLFEDVAEADLVVMIAAAGDDAEGASVIGEVCSLRRVMTTTLVVQGADRTDAALSRTLAQVRPWSLMVIVVSDEAYIEDILRSFR